MTRPILLLIAAALAAGLLPGRAAASVREQAIVWRSGDVELAGLLLVPAGAGRRPAAVIVQGSGEADRTNAWARAVADTIVASGLVVLLTDKRGSGASGGDWRSVGFDTLARDALSAVEALARRPEVDPGRIGLVGLSQGGRVVPVAAARSDDVAFVVNLVGDAISFAEQSAHEMANVARQAGLPEPMRRQVLELNAAAGRALLSGDWHDYRRLRAEGLSSPWASIAQGFPPAGHPVWTFYAQSITFDPMPYWILVRQPTLIIYGEEDEADNVAVSESVRRLTFGFEQAGKRNHEILVVPGVGHALGWTPGAGLGPVASDALRRWLTANALPQDREPRRGRP